MTDPKRPPDIQESLSIPKRDMVWVVLLIVSSIGFIIASFLLLSVPGLFGSLS